MKTCPECGGSGIVAEHDIPANHGEYGECISCPVQAPCVVCQMTGEVEDGYIEEQSNKVLNNNDLPF